MNSMNRRDLCVALSGFVALGAVAAEAQSQEDKLPEAKALPAPPGSAGATLLAMPRAFRFGDLTVAKTANGESRAVVRAVLPTGEAVELHETTLLPGRMPHLPHRHRHSEFMLISRRAVGDRQ